MPKYEIERVYNEYDLAKDWLRKIKQITVKGTIKKSPNLISNDSIISFLYFMIGK